jgi:hypothetical protein
VSKRFILKLEKGDQVACLGILSVLDIRPLSFNFVEESLVPHLAVVAFNLVTIILVLIFVRFRLVDRFSKTVCLVLDTFIILLLLVLAFICLRFSSV